MAETNQQLVTRIANEEGISPDLALRVASTESNFNSNAVSPKGARGLMQVMPATYTEVMGKDSDPSNVDNNVRAGLRYLGKQLKDFNGDVPLSLAAYNAGPGAVRKYNGIPPYKETQDYVRKITGKSNAPAPKDAGYKVIGYLDENGVETPSTAPQRKPSATAGQGYKVLGYIDEEAPAPPAQAPLTASEPTYGDRAKDLAISGVQGVVAFGESVVGLGDIVSGGRVGKLAEQAGVRFKETDQILEGWKSTAGQQDKAALDNAQGFMGTANAIIDNPNLIPNAIARTIPSILGGSAYGQALIKLIPKIGAVTAGAVGEGIIGAGSQAENIRTQTSDGLTTPTQSALAAATGLTTGVISRFSGNFAQKLGIKDIDNVLVNGSAEQVDEVVKKSLARKLVEGGLTEAVLEEMPQSGIEQMLSNVALDKPIMEGVAKSAAIGGLTAAPMGAGAQLIPQSTAVPQTRGQRIIETLKARKAAQEQAVSTEINQDDLLSQINQYTGNEAIDATNLLDEENVSNIEQGATSTLDSGTIATELNNASGSAIDTTLDGDVLRPASGGQSDASNLPTGTTSERDGALDNPTPEPQITLQAQTDAFIAGNKPALLITPGETMPANLPNDIKAATIPNRGTLIYRDDANLQQALNGNMGEALGYGINEKPAQPTAVITARDANGTVIQDVATDGRQSVVDAAKQVAGNGTVEMRPIEAAMQEREAGINAQTSITSENGKVAQTKPVLAPVLDNLESSLQNNPAILEPETTISKVKAPKKPRKTTNTLHKQAMSNGGISRMDAIEIYGLNLPKGINPSAAKAALFRKNGRDIISQVSDGLYDDFLPSDMRHDSFTFDSVKSEAYVKDLLAQRTTVLPYNAQKELNNSAMYERYNGSAEADINDAELFTDDEINGMLREAGYDEREATTDAQVFEDNQDDQSESQPRSTQSRNQTTLNEPNTQNQNSSAIGNEGTQSGTASAERDQQQSAPVKPQENTRPIVEAITKRRAAAAQIGKEKAFDTYLALAKKLMNGEVVKPTNFKLAAASFKADAKLAEAFNQLQAIAQAPEKEARAEKTNTIEAYKQRIADAKTIDALQTIAGEIQRDSALSDSQAATLDDAVFDAQDALNIEDDSIGPDLAQNDTKNVQEPSKQTADRQDQPLSQPKTEESPEAAPVKADVQALENANDKPMDNQQKAAVVAGRDYLQWKKIDWKGEDYWVKVFTSFNPYIENPTGYFRDSLVWAIGKTNYTDADTGNPVSINEITGNALEKLPKGLTKQASDFYQEKQDELLNKSNSNADLLGDNTQSKQAIADAERAKDAKRNTGNGETEGFTLTGSNSEADKAIANGAQALFSRAANKTQTDTPAFKKWFGDSVVTDNGKTMAEGGKPMVVYHGSPNKFNEFKFNGGDRTMLGSQYQVESKAFFFTPEKSAADNFYRQNGEIKEVFLKASNIDDWANGLDSDLYNYAKALNILPYRKTDYWQLLDNDQFVVRIKELGYDGVKLSEENEDDVFDSYIIFEPNQIKSSTNNNGNFDPDNNDIRFSRSNPTFYSALTRAIENIQTKKADPKMWQGMIKNLAQKGVKPDEIEWTGINDWLALQTGAVTKEQVLEYLNGNGVQVEETVLIGDSTKNYDFRLNKDETAFNIFSNGEIIETVDTADEALNRLNKLRNDGTKYSKYTVPGGKNYKELLLTLPENNKFSDKDREEMNRLAMRMNNDINFSDSDKNRYNELNKKSAKRIDTNYKSSHFDQPNILAHVRFDERTDADGNKVLFLQEIQSDWGQTAKKEGIAKEDNGVARRAEIKAQMDILSAKSRALRAEGKGTTTEAQDLRKQLHKLDDELRFVATPKGVPNAPFIGKTDAWVSLAIKRMMRYAAENGFDKVAIINGQQAADLYDLSKQVDAISYMKNKDGTYHVVAEPIGGGNSVELGSNNTEQELESKVGKDVAQKIINGEGKFSGGDFTTLKGVDLKVGGEGMRTFYDSIVPKVTKDVLKKLGGSVDSTVANSSEYQATPSKYDMTWEVRDGNNKGFKTQADAESYLADKYGVKQTSFTITPAMRETIMGGLPLFSRNDPFFSLGTGTKLELTKSKSQFGAKVLNKALVKYFGDNWSDSYESVDVPDTLLAYQQEIKAAFGKELRYVSPTSKEFDIFAGVQLPNSPNSIYVNARAETNLTTIAGHELYHTLERARPDLHKWFKAQAEKYIQDFGAYHENLNKKLKEGEKPYKTDTALSELLADFTGDALSDTKFLQELANADGNKFKGFLNATIRFLNTSILKLKNLGSSRYISDVEALRDSLKKSLLAFSNGTHIAESAPKPFSNNATQNIPDAIILNPLGTAKIDADYEAAKAGNVEAATRLAKKLVTNDVIKQLKEQIKNADLVAGVTSVEQSGNNALPEAAAILIAEKLGLKYDENLLQLVSPKRTGMSGMDRIFNRPVFDGEVENGASYVLVDDTITQGGTFAAMASHIQEGGASVIANIALTGKDYSSKIALSEKMLETVRRQFGDLENEFRSITQYGFEGLTHSEARFITLGNTPDKFRDRIIAETKKAASSTDSQATKAKQDVKFSRASTANTAPPTGGVSTSAKQLPLNPDLDIPAETNAQAIQRIGQDKFNRFKVLQDWLVANGLELSEAADVFQAETLMSGRVAVRKEDFREGQVESLIKRTQAADLSMEQIGEFLKVQHAPEANKRARELQGKADATAYGVSDQEANSAMAEFKALPKFAELKSIANAWRAITEQTKQIKVESGLLTPEMVAAWESTYELYVPVKGNDDDKSGTGQGLNVKVRNKQRLGHSLRDEAIIENILRDHEAAISLDENNRVGKALIKFALEVKNDAIITIGKPEKRKVLKQGDSAYMVNYYGSDVATFETINDARAYVNDAVLKGGDKAGFDIQKTSDAVRVMLQASPQLADNEVTVYVGGHAVRLQINDEIAAREYKNMGVEHLNTVLAAGREVNNWLSKVYTGYSPDFIFTNPIRDAIQGAITLTGNLGGLTTAKIFANYPTAIKELIKHFRNKGASDLVNEYRAMGGSTGGAYLSDLERIGNDIQDSYNEYQGALATYKSSYDKKIAEGKSTRIAHMSASLKAGLAGFHKIPIIGHFLKLMESVNAITENALRVATYKTLVENGMSKGKAAAQAKNLMNFNRKGEQANAAGALYLFFNPAVQGTKLIQEALTSSPHKRQAQALAGSMTLMAFTLSMMALSGDDEDKDKWQKTPDYIKDGNIVFDMFGTQFTITLPYGYRVFWTLGNVMADATQKGADLGKLGNRVASSLFANFSPIGNPMEGENGLFQLLPTSPKMALAPGVNEDSFGRPISPKKWNQATPDSQLMNRGTHGSLYDGVAEKMNEFSGGSKYKSGAADVSPETLKFWVKSLTGGAGQFAFDSINMVKQGAQGVTPQNLKDIPVVRKFARETGVTDSRSAFWERKNEADMAADQLSLAKKSHDREALMELRQNNGVLIRMSKMSDRMLKMANAKRQAISNIKLDDSIVLKDKIRMINQIENEEQKIYDKYIEIFNAKIKQ